MKRRRVSLKDLAEELGVSIATVSRALHGSHEVGDDMRKKVVEITMLPFLTVLNNMPPNWDIRSSAQIAMRAVSWRNVQ